MPTARFEKERFEKRAEKKHLEALRTGSACSIFMTDEEKKESGLGIGDRFRLALEKGGWRLARIIGIQPEENGWSYICTAG